MSATLSLLPPSPVSFKAFAAEVPISAQSLLPMPSSNMHLEVEQKQKEREPAKAQLPDLSTLIIPPFPPQEVEEERIQSLSTVSKEAEDNLQTRKEKEKKAARRRYLISPKAEAQQQVFVSFLNRADKACAYSPDGRHLAVTAGKVIKICDTTTRAVVHILEGHTDSVTCVSYCLSGDYLASGSADNTLRLWDRKSGACAGKVRCEIVVSRCFWHPRVLPYLVSGHLDGSVCYWSLGEDISLSEVSVELVWTSRQGALGSGSDNFEDAGEVSPKKDMVFLQKGEGLYAVESKGNEEEESKCVAYDVGIARSVAVLRQGYVVSPVFNLEPQVPSESVDFPAAVQGALSTE